MNTRELWQTALGELELTLSKVNFTTWFKNTFISSCEEDRVVISVPNAFTKAWLEKKYNTAIVKCLQNATNNRVREVIYKVELHPQSRPAAAESQAQMMHGQDTVVVQRPAQEYAELQKKEFASESKLNPKYTFDSFIVGKGNELAHAAALAIAENPGTKYNPLFIYGGVGLGKTHLIQAIGNNMLQKNPGAKILYVTCEKFTNEFINAVKNGRGKEFKDTYRTVDLLMIDDIQFLTGKDGTQEEFFHTFNALHQADKQVILTSDRPPKQIPALEQRITSRLEWGMMADISSPDFETRIAILETKCKERNYELEPEIVRYLATIVQSNVRELEGALNKIIAFHQFKNIKPTLEGVKSILTSFNPSHTKKNVTVKHIINTVSSYFDVAVPDITGKCRERRLAFPRQIIMYLIREELNASYPTIGNELGGRDHTTAMHACNKIGTELENDPKLRQDIELIKQRVYNT